MEQNTMPEPERPEFNPPEGHVVKWTDWKSYTDSYDGKPYLAFTVRMTAVPVPPGLPTTEVEHHDAPGVTFLTIGTKIKPVGAADDATGEGAQLYYPFATFSARCIDTPEAREKLYAFVRAGTLPIQAEGQAPTVIA